MYVVDQGSHRVLQSRFVILERRSLQAVGCPASRVSTGASTVASPSHADADMGHFQSASSMSDEVLPDGDSDMLSHAAFSTTTPRSNFASHTASALTTPGSYILSHDADSNAAAPFSLAESDLTTSLHTNHDFGAGVLPSICTYLEPNGGALPLDNRVLDPGSPWGVTNFSSPASKGENAATGVEMGQGGHKSTLTVEDVQPQMVTKILNLFYE